MSINLIALFGDTIARAIIVSCASVCGDGERESAPTTVPLLPTTYHGSSLQAMEKLWNLYAGDSGTPVTCIRFAPSMVQGVAGMETGAGGECLTSSAAKVSRVTLEALEKHEGGLITLCPEIQTG